MALSKPEIDLFRSNFYSSYEEIDYELAQQTA
jgi:hypothetical protein